MSSYSIEIKVRQHFDLSNEVQKYQEAKYNPFSSELQAAIIRLSQKKPDADYADVTLRADSVTKLMAKATKYLELLNEEQ